MSLDLSSLQKAVLSLERAVRLTEDRIARNETPADEIELLKAGVIHNFEVSFDRCWKMLKRQMGQEVPSLSEVDTWSYKHLFRIGGERGLIDDVDAWFVFRDKRNFTAQTYNEDKAKEVFTEIPRFSAAAADLLHRLQERNTD